MRRASIRTVVLGALLAFSGGVFAAGTAAESQPAAKRNLLTASQPRWHELTPVQRETLEPLQSSWNTLPASRRKVWIALTDRMPGMSPDDQAAARARIREWAALSPDERRMARENFRLAKSLDKDERVASWESYQQLTPEQQAVLRSNGWTSNTAARHAGAPNGLAREAARPLAASPSTTQAATQATRQPKVARPATKPGATSDPASGTVAAD